MAGDGEVKQRQHFYYHGDCHPKSGYVTTKLHESLQVFCRLRMPATLLSGRSEALAVHAKLERWQHC